MSRIKDPKHYREISVPFNELQAANAALVEFFRDVEIARNKHRIPDVVVLCEVSHELDGEELRGSANATFGDSSRVVTMLAREYGAAQARHEEEIALIMAHARKSVRK